MNDVSCGRKHGDTAVLEFSGTEPRKSLITADVGKTKRIEVLDRSAVSWQAFNTGLEAGAGSLNETKANNMN